jgi:hypothetical protein
MIGVGTSLSDPKIVMGVHYGDWEQFLADPKIRD